MWCLQPVDACGMSMMALQESWRGQAKWVKLTALATQKIVRGTTSVSVGCIGTLLAKRNLSSSFQLCKEIQEPATAGFPHVRLAEQSLSSPQTASKGCCQ